MTEIELRILDYLVYKFNIGETCIKKHGSRTKLSWSNFISLAVKESSSTLYKACGFINKDSFSRYFNKHYKHIMLDKGSFRWKAYLLSIVDHKFCYSCCSSLPKYYFVKDTSRYDGLHSACKRCSGIYYKKYSKVNSKYINYYSSKRRAHKLQATPNWANQERIKEKYLACPQGYHVDHIVPLKNDIVCGLHCEFNLQHLSAYDNLIKSNKFEIV